MARATLGELARRFRDDVKGEIVLVIAPARSEGAEGPDLAFAVDALRRLVQSGARPRAAASVVGALTGRARTTSIAASRGAIHANNPPFQGSFGRA